ncbi:hypothetical protein Pcinc_015150 [Petrolisthes cinctipes]|uniref:RNase H type-1 domain-containing protein n=1 Tax=Petrolisthes cinctipes TaxID=88211 RepID=A0AAE1FV29_PETCI|nr:hypothetical protein Pcinc_015150 [Petrolisthes cinctipes]
MRFPLGRGGERGGNTGAAFISGEILQTFHLADYSSSYQAELVGILRVLRHTEVQQATTINVFVDSLSTAVPLTGHTKDNRFLLSQIQSSRQTLHRLRKSTSFHWVLGHISIAGNKRSDAAARNAGQGPEVNFAVPPSYGNIKSAVNRTAFVANLDVLHDFRALGSRTADWFITITDLQPL